MNTQINNNNKITEGISKMDSDVMEYKYVGRKESDLTKRMKIKNKTFKYGFEVINNKIVKKIEVVSNG